MPKSDDTTNALWVTLSGYGEGNIFHVYPKILEELLKKEEEEKVQGDTTEAEKLVLPSNREWRIKQYYMLVELQKTLELEKLVWVEDGEQVGVNKVLGKRERSVEAWSPWHVVADYTKNTRAPPPVRITPTTEPPWDIAKVILAAKLLMKPPQPVNFKDEQEMRCVYSLIYDVFRYKTILDEVIWTTDFYSKHPQSERYRRFEKLQTSTDTTNSVLESTKGKGSKFTDYNQLTWLFLMELARRRWEARPRNEVENATKLLDQAGFPYCDLEKAVFEERVHFAACVSKIRIREQAFLLSELLPPHLRDERVSACVNKETITGWVNTFKEKKVASLVKKLSDYGYTYSSSRQLCAGEYKFDRVCPRFITIYPRTDYSIGSLDLVRDHVIVLQEREFCEGASTLCRALKMYNLRGVIAQSHVNSPRCTAYLAAQLRELSAVIKSESPPAPVVPELGRLIVFSAGDGVQKYVNALKDLGIDASTKLSDKAVVTVLVDPIYAETSTVTQALEGVVAALATPPNSYSAVTDPIDLVCGRGGDLTMLEILTDAEVDNAGKSRVGMILEEQRKTLKALLSKPQIQLVLYETHSALEAENQAQVIRAVSDANALARDNHILNKKIPSPCKTIEENVEPASHAVLPGDTKKNYDSDAERGTSPKRHDKGDLASPPESRTSSPVRKKKPPTETVLKKQVDAPEKLTRVGTTKARPIPDMSQNYTTDFTEITVPKCDLFQISNLPNLGNGLDINYILSRDGVYLGLIHRKEFTRLDAKYMIKVAEERGLFGGNADPSNTRRERQDTSRTPKKKRKKNAAFEVVHMLRKQEKRVERIAAPTLASLQRSNRRGSAPIPMDVTDGCECERHLRRQAAANSFTSACTCDAGHRQRLNSNKSLSRYRSRRGSIGKRPSSPPLPCRQPFPVTVYDLRLPTIDHTTNMDGGVWQPSTITMLPPAPARDCESGYTLNSVDLNQLHDNLGKALNTNPTIPMFSDKQHQMTHNRRQTSDSCHWLK